MTAVEPLARWNGTRVTPDIGLRLDRRIIPEESADEVEAHLRKVITGSVGDRTGIRVIRGDAGGRSAAEVAVLSWQLDTARPAWAG